MTERNPYALLRPYYKGHDLEQDEKLAEELFYGTTVRDKKTGRDCHRYPPEDSADERRGLEALCRLLVFSDLAPDILSGLLCSLDPVGSFGRRLVFKQRKRKRRADSATDLQIALHIRSLYRRLGKKESAVRQAMKDFDLSRNAVFEAMARIRAESPWLGV